MLQRWHKFWALSACSLDNNCQTSFKSKPLASLQTNHPLNVLLKKLFLFFIEFKWEIFFFLNLICFKGAADEFGLCVVVITWMKYRGYLSSARHEFLVGILQTDMIANVNFWLALLFLCFFLFLLSDYYFKQF